MKHIASFIYLSTLIFNVVSAQEGDSSKHGKALSVFNVVTFPNDACGASNGYNGTCYTTSECTSKGGTASGTCASSFGVCCVFSLSCGGSSSANNSYAIISSYSTSSDKDPCTYTFCKTNSDVCKLRIDFDTMVLADPGTSISSTAGTDGLLIGNCKTDSLTVSNPGGQVPPTICGYNTGQHMWVPASEQCNSINIDIDTGSTGTTRKWTIKVTQYECGNMMAPEQDCLQYHTAASGTIATFNYDTSSSSVATTQVHLAHQYYDICIRRKRSYCSVCFSPYIHAPTTSTTAASSFGLSAGSLAPAQTASVGSICTGATAASGTEANLVGYGDYIEIAALQPSTGTSTTVVGLHRLCGSFFQGSTTAGTAHETACSYATPFKVGVHFDGEDAIFSPVTSTKLNLAENAPISKGSGRGYQGFWLNYWQNSC